MGTRNNIFLIFLVNVNKDNVIPTIIEDKEEFRNDYA